MPCEKTILIIVEEENLRRSLTLLLERSGYAVVCAFEAEEALRKIQSGPCDLALIDVKVNSRFSREIIPLISECNPEIPVLILVPSVPTEDVQSSHRRIEHMVKPIDPPTLLAHLRYSLTAGS